MYEHRLDSTIEALPEIIRDMMSLGMTDQHESNLFRPTLSGVLHMVEQVQLGLEAMERKFAFLADRPSAVSEIQAIKEAHLQEVTRLTLDRDRHMLRANAAEALNAALIERQAGGRGGGFHHTEQMFRHRETEERLAARLRTLYRPYPEASQFTCQSTKDQAAPAPRAQDEPTLSELMESSRPLKESFLTEGNNPKNHR